MIKINIHNAWSSICYIDLHTTVDYKINLCIVCFDEHFRRAYLQLKDINSNQGV